jgi:hypothetical protein
MDGLGVTWPLWGGKMAQRMIPTVSQDLTCQPFFVGGEPWYNAGGLKLEVKENRK